MSNAVGNGLPATFVATSWHEWATVCHAGGDTVVDVARHASDLPADPVIVVTNPDEDCSPEAFRTLIDETLAGPEPEIDNIGAAEALRELRLDAECLH